MELMHVKIVANRPMENGQNAARAATGSATPAHARILPVVATYSRARRA